MPATPAPIPVTVAHGDGIGPEIMAATLQVLEASGAPLAPEVIDIGEAVYRSGYSAGIRPDAWESLRRTRVFLKAPITTPQGGGYKSLNVTIRKTLGLFANIRPCTAYSPFVSTRHPGMDVVIVRENEEDLYAGIEHRHTDEVVQCLKLISRPGCERLIRYAFDYARAHGRRKVSCFTKDNIMKLTDGLFHRVFQEVGAAYPDLEQEHLIVDIGAARLADTPEAFDVVVLPNLYGDILSDVAAQVAGSVGLAGSANIGPQAAMFEAIHGSAPQLAGKDIANPSGLMLAAVQMLVHVGCPREAAMIHNAWLATIESGVHTRDIFSPGRSTRLVGTQAFAHEVIRRLGRMPQVLPAVSYDAAPAGGIPVAPLAPRRPALKRTVGVDLFLDAPGAQAADLAARLTAVVLAPETAGMGLVMITNRGVKVWPDGLPETFCTDHWRCRLEVAGDRPLTADMMAALLARAGAAGLDVVKLETLRTFDGEPGFSLGQGQ
ncbi:NADP-dependent isocitrate dehydrogenase [Caenispirillum bisanense]|uniref:NADP-dependent isocitrate dehydrogenase n=1 Tax=Caenispirillum bisanense TaxID=414052 RepID=UPI0031D48445